MARRCISANAIHFPSSIELDIRYFAIGYTVFNAAVTAVSLCAAVLRSPKPKFCSVQRYCAHRNPGFALCSDIALTETQVLICAAVLHSPKYSDSAQSETWVSVSAVPLHRAKLRFR